MGVGYRLQVAGNVLYGGRWKGFVKVKRFRG